METPSYASLCEPLTAVSVFRTRSHTVCWIRKRFGPAQTSSAARDTSELTRSFRNESNSDSHGFAITFRMTCRKVRLIFARLSQVLPARVDLGAFVSYDFFHRRILGLDTSL